MFITLYYNFLSRKIIWRKFFFEILATFAKVTKKTIVLGLLFFNGAQQYK